MTCREAESLIDEYVRWLREQISVKDVSGVCEITTPFLDRHNDAIVIYLKKKGHEIVLSDDGYTLADLAITGIEMTEHRQAVLMSVLNGLGVSLKNTELIVTSSEKDFPRRKNEMLQAILAVNDMFMTGREIAKSVFLEEVEEFLKKSDVHFTKALSIRGKSGMDHHFDFVVPRSVKQPERLIQTVGSPDKNAVVNRVLWPLGDIKEQRLKGSRLFAFLNDKDGINPELPEYVKNCGATPVVWSARESVVELLAGI